MRRCSPGALQILVDVLRGILALPRGVAMATLGRATRGEGPKSDLTTVVAARRRRWVRIQSMMTRSACAAGGLLVAAKGREASYQIR